MDTQILEDIGLTHAEIKVYLALLELGTSMAGPVIEKSGLQSSVVHITLSRLVDKGLISFVKEGKRNHYQAANPKHILDFIDEKKERLQDILPQLLSRQHMPKQDVTVFRGVKGMRELLYTLLEAGGKEHHTIGSPEKSLMMGDTFWMAYHRKRARKGIGAKLLFNESLRKWVVESEYREMNTDLRFMKEGVEPLTETIIRNDKVGIIIWMEKPIGILIHNKVFAESYDNYFFLLWNSAKK